MTRMMLAACAFVCLLGCGGGGGGETPKTPEGPAPQTFDQQVALGQKIYGEKCARCHGDSGQGTDKGPMVVGIDKGALPLDPPQSRKFRKNQFKTAMDVAQFVMTNMPADNPGSLTQEEYLAVLAFDLKANGVNLDKKLTPEVAPTINIH